MRDRAKYEWQGIADQIEEIPVLHSALTVSTLDSIPKPRPMAASGRRLALRLLVALAAAWPLADASAQAASAYPSRNILIVVPHPPSTGADILSRVLGPRLAEHWKVGVVTENRTGAGGIIGTDIVAKSPPDGHTLLFTATSFGTNPAFGQKLPFDPVKSFAPVVLVATSAVSLIVASQLPARTFREFVESARRQAGKLYYSSAGNGTPQHLAMELLKLETGIDLVHVPYKGSGAAMADLIGGHVQATILSLQTAAPYVHAGKLRMLAVMSAERSPAFADVPTLAELGLTNFEVETWYGILAPAGTPAAAIAKLNAEINALLQRAEIRSLLAQQGMAAQGGPPGRFGDLIKVELARWSRVVAATGIKPD